MFVGTFVPHRHLSFISSLSRLFVFYSGFLLFIRLYFCVFPAGHLTSISSSVSAPNPPGQGRAALRLGVKDVKAIRISIRVIISPDSGGPSPASAASGVWLITDTQIIIFLLFTCKQQVWMFHPDRHGQHIQALVLLSIVGYASFLFLLLHFRPLNLFDRFKIFNTLEDQSHISSGNYWQYLLIILRKQMWSDLISEFLKKKIEIQINTIIEQKRSFIYLKFWEIIFKMRPNQIYFSPVMLIFFIPSFSIKYSTFFSVF